MYENLAAGSLAAAGARDAGPEYAEPSRQRMVDYDAEKVEHAERVASHVYDVPVQRPAQPELDPCDYVAGHDAPRHTEGDDYAVAGVDQEDPEYAVPGAAAASSAGAVLGAVDYAPLHGFRQTHSGGAPEEVPYSVLDGAQDGYADSAAIAAAQGRRDQPETARAGPDHDPRSGGGGGGGGGFSRSGRKPSVYAGFAAGGGGSEA